jgi:hypothetical protein
MAVDIREIEYSGWLVSKVNGRHSCTIDDVFDAVENYIAATWEDHPDKGLRLLVKGHTAQGRVLRVFLYPVDVEAGTFRLGTAF